jgi:hypothetical protein
MTATSTHDLAQRRLDAADALETKIAALGTAYKTYLEATAALEQRAGVDLARYLDVPIVLAMNKAGLSTFLESKLQGVPPPLRVTCETQHLRTPQVAERVD